MVIYRLYFFNPNQINSVSDSEILSKFIIFFPHFSLALSLAFNSIQINLLFESIKQSSRRPTTQTPRAAGRSRRRSRRRRREEKMLGGWWQRRQRSSPRRRRSSSSGGSRRNRRRRSAYERAYRPPNQLQLLYYSYLWRRRDRSVGVVFASFPFCCCFCSRRAGG